MPTSRTDIARRSTTAPPAENAVSIHYADLDPGVVGAFTHPGLPAQERVTRTRRMVADIVGPGTEVRLHLSGAIPITIATVHANHGIGLSGEYTTSRGANVVGAKTMAAPNGSFDIVFDAGVFFDDEGATKAQRRLQTRVVMHLVAHEAQHVLLHLSHTDHLYYRDGVASTITARALRGMVSEALDEYRCELAANRIFAGAPTRESVAGEDLDAMRKSLNDAREMCATDSSAAFDTTMLAVSVMFKVIAYLAAEFRCDQRSAEPPSPLPSEWTRYVAGLWPDMVTQLSRLPAADASCTRETLTQVLEASCARLATWLDEIGIRFEMFEDGRWSCYWDREHY